MGVCPARTARHLGLLLGAALLAVLPLARSAQAAGGVPDTLRLATGSVGGTFLPVGRDLADWWARTVPGVVVVPITTAGSVDNLDRLADGEADLAIVGSSPFREVLNGWGAPTDGVKQICTLGTLYVDAEQYVVRSSLVRVGNLLDLSGLLMYPGPHQSGGEIDTRLILSTLDIEPRYVYVDERDKGYSAAATALERGDFDAATFSGGVPIQAVSRLLRERPGEFTILPFSKHMLNKLQHAEDDFEGVIIRASSYPGLESDVHTVGGPNLLVAAPHLDASILEALERAVREGIRTPGQGLRAPESHPVLQALDLKLWTEDPIAARCVETRMADLGLSSPGRDTSPR